MTPGAWYALRTKHSRELFAELALKEKGYEAFCPTYLYRVRRREMVITTKLPLFPGYVFCRYNHSIAGLMVTTSGVIGIVKIGCEPARVDDVQIENVSRLCNAQVSQMPWRYVPVGTAVRIDSGPFTGVTGVLMAFGERHQLIVSISILQRSVSTMLDPSTAVTVLAGPASSPEEKFAAAVLA